ncbi:AMT1-1 [Symbiodinium natans]|uniref:AMT1-1 protein n=1 Tax=Symbiodinium natans TaxID=878477 RepID=A0A812IET0_9DINO|nr:AMT1-1 [Symbiodinium natans]
MDATALRLLRQLLAPDATAQHSEEHDKVPHDVMAAGSLTSTASFEGLQQHLTSLDSLLHNVYERQDQSSVAIAARMASLERQIGKLHGRYVKGAKTRSKVMRKRFPTSSASSETARKKPKVQETLPPMCIERDDPAQRPAGSCAYFRMDAEDEESDHEPLEAATPATSDASTAASPSDLGTLADDMSKHAVPDIPASWMCEPESGNRSLFFDVCHGSPFLQGVLDFLRVLEIVRWRATSRQAKEPKALMLHLEDWGSFSRPASVLDFCKIHAGIADACRGLPETSEARGQVIKSRCDGNLTLEKVFRSQCWLCEQTSARWACFPESEVKEMTRTVIRELLLQCHCVDDVVFLGGFAVLDWIAPYGRRDVQEDIGFAFLGVLSSLLLRPKEYWSRKRRLMRSVVKIYQSLGAAQRQGWVAVLARLLKQEDEREKQEFIISTIEIFYLGDAEPRKTFAPADTELEEIQHDRSTTAAVRRALSAMRFPGA